MTKTVASIINDLCWRLEKEERETNQFRNNDGGRRNDLAFEAASQNADKGRRLRMLPNNQVMAEMWKVYENSKHWEEQYRNWGGHDNGYAEECHKRSKDAFYDAYLAVKKLHNTCADVNFELVLIWSCAGGSNGVRKFEVAEGHTSTSTIGSELSASISANIGGPLKTFTGGFEASVSGKLQNSFTTTSYQHKKESYEIKMDKPCFVYQVKSSVRDGIDNTYTIGGAVQIFDHNIHDTEKK